MSGIKHFCSLFPQLTFALLFVTLTTLAAIGHDGHHDDPVLQPAPNYGVAIPRTAFGKDFLISASLIPQSVVATSEGLAGKVVQFELFHDGVDLYESTAGVIVTQDLPARRLITTFPIVEQDDERVIIDFNQGMRRVYTAGWYSMGGQSQIARDQVVEMTQARVFHVGTEGDHLVVKQSVQIRDLQNRANSEERYEVRYFIMPHSMGDFKSREHNKVDSPHVRFFQTQPQLEDTTGRPTSKIATFDIEKPITFYYSANTPPDYVQSMRDGILYWNKVFGREIVKAEVAPAGVTAPDAAHNVVQWVPWDNAGFAYADILVDPRTGESVRGQAYMTSVFAISGKSRARVLLRAMRAMAATESQEPAPEKQAAPWPHSSVCDLDPREFADQLANGLEALLANEKMTDEAILRISQDYVLNTVAHEVGHCLGLRHNFAGSLASTMTHKELDQWLEALIAQDDKALAKFNSKITSSSVMDYQVFLGRAFSGYRIRTVQDPLPHDRAAIHWGYYDDKAVTKNKMFFGTDDEVGQWGDVNRFDFGTEPVIGAYAEVSEAVYGLATSVIESFIRAKAPRDPRDRLPLEQVNFNPRSEASTIGRSIGRLLSWFDASTRSLAVEKEFPYVGDLNREERYQAHWQKLNKQLTSLGGIDQAIFSYLPLDLKIKPKEFEADVRPTTKIHAKDLSKRLKALLDSDAYKEFVGLDDKTYRFTEEEKTLIQERGKRFFEKLEHELIKNLCSVFASAKRDLGQKAAGFVGEDDAVATLEKKIIEFATAVLLAKAETQRISGMVDKSHVTITDYKYDHETRLAAAKALGDASGSYSSWSKEAKANVHAKLKAQVDGMLNIQNFKDFKDSILSRPLRDWYLKQQQLLRLLPPKKG